MALPMDEQRILEEMERMLAADDPKLAARLAAFGQPGFGQVLRTKRARATLSIMLLVLIAAVAAVIYLVSVLRTGNTGPGHSQRSAQTATPSPGQVTTPQSRVSGRTGNPAARQGRSASPGQACTPAQAPQCRTGGQQPSQGATAAAKARAGGSG